MGKAADCESLVCGLSSRPANQKKRKIRSTGACPASRDLLFKFWDTLHIPGMDIARDFKFGVRIDRQAYKPKMQRQVKRVSRRSRDPYFSFRTSFDLWNDIHYVCRITNMSKTKCDLFYNQ